MKPMIGIIPLMDYEKESYWMLPGYNKVVEKAGGIPVMLPLIKNEDDICQLVSSFDGFIITGGQDVNPTIYKEPILDVCGELCIERDEMEVLFIQEIMKQDKPTLGICRGIQILNAACGGTLYQDLPSQYESNVSHTMKPPYDNKVHTVSLVKDTYLQNLLKKDVLPVNSCHHQAIKDLSPEFEAIGISEDGLVEAIKGKKNTYLVAVQWHPEFMYKTDEDSQILVDDFVKACVK